MSGNGKRDFQIPSRSVRSIERLPENTTIEIIPDGATLIVLIAVGLRTFELIIDRETAKSFADFLKTQAES